MAIIGNIPYFQTNPYRVHRVPAAWTWTKLNKHTMTSIGSEPASPEPKPKPIPTCHTSRTRWLPFHNSRRHHQSSFQASSKQCRRGSISAFALAGVLCGGTEIFIRSWNSSCASQNFQKHRMDIYTYISNYIRSKTLPPSKFEQVEVHFWFSRTAWRSWENW